MINWKTYQISSADLSITLVPAIGGRILSLVFNQQELLFVQEENRDQIYDFTGKGLVEEKKRLGFRLWGGDKTWVAPQSAWVLGIPPLELDAGQYDVVQHDDALIMTSPICRETGLQIIRNVRLVHQSIYLTETIINQALTPRSCGVWNVSQIKRPCRFIVAAAPTGFRSYHHEDKTLPVVSEPIYLDGSVVVDCQGDQMFKYGGMPLEGKVVTEIPTTDNRMISWIRTFAMDKTMPYAHRSAVEFFNSPDYPYAEAEVHAPQVCLKQGESTSLSQCWTFTV